MRTPNRTKLTRLLLAQAAFLVLLVPLGSVVGQEKTKDAGAEPPKKTEKATAGGVVEVSLTDGSTLKLQLRDPTIEFETAYGKLQIPVADIQRIEFGQRIPDSVRKRVDAAIVDLGNTDFRRRQAAMKELLALKAQAYPALAQAAKGKDAETVRRVEELLDKIRDAVPADVLEIPQYDVVHTADSKIAGRLQADVLHISTRAFGDQQLKLTDMRSLRTQNAGEKEVALDKLLPDPGTLAGYANQVGKTLVFRVTAPPLLGVGQRLGVYGTDIYTADSSLAHSAVHAGALKPGQTGAVRVTILGQQPGFQSTLRNGILSNDYGPWPGFRIEKARGARP